MKVISSGSLWAAVFGAGLVISLPVVSFAQVVAPYDGADQLPEMTLNMSELSAPGSGSGKATQAFVDYVRDASGGKIHIEVFWSGSLLATTEVPNGVASGTADMGQSLPVYTPADFPVTNWLSTVSNQLKGGQPFGKLVASAANSEFHAVNKVIRKEFEDRGLHILGANGQTAYDLFCNKPVHNLAEAKGKRVRSPAQNFARESEAIGMTPVPVVGAELYEAFSRGIVDCMILFPAANIDWGTTGIPGKKYWLNIELSGFIANLLVVNKEKWDAMSPVARRILTDGYTLLLQTEVQNTYATTREFGDLIRSGEIDAVQPDADLLDALAVHQEKELAAMASSAPADVENPRAVVDEYLALIDKWRTIVSDELGIAPAPANAADIVGTWYADYDFGPFQKRLSDELAKAQDSANQATR